LRLSSFGGYGLALAALALVVFGAYDSYPENANFKNEEARKHRNSEQEKDRNEVCSELMNADGRVRVQ